MSTPRLPRPSDCPICQRGLLRMRQYARVRWSVFPVKTWCRVCGAPALLEVQGPYDIALRYAYRLDDAVMEHNGHEEAGNWGVHWRLDEVMRLVFPQEHTEECWPKMGWYQYGQAEDQRVVVASDEDGYFDERRRLMVREVNSNPKRRRELEQLGNEVWDTEELARDFAVLGFRAPFVVVERYSDGARGSLMFQDDPRFYFDFRTDRVL